MSAWGVTSLAKSAKLSAAHISGSKVAAPRQHGSERDDEGPGQERHRSTSSRDSPADRTQREQQCRMVAARWDILRADAGRFMLRGRSFATIRGECGPNALKLFDPGIS